MICFSISSGRWFQISSAEYGLASRKTPPGLTFESMSYFSTKEKLWQATKSAFVQR